MECPTAPRVMLLRLHCDGYVRYCVRVGDGRVTLKTEFNPSCFEIAFVD